MQDEVTGRLRPGVLLDRDGTIIVDHGYVGSIDRVDVIDGAPQAISALNRAGIPVAVVTNQSGVARGYYSLSAVEEVHAYIAAQLALAGAHVDMFLFCPYHRDGTVAAFARHSEDRKPQPGMAIAAATALSLDLRTSWVIGDRLEDAGLAKAVGASAVLVGGASADGAWACASLADAVPYVLGHLAARTPSAPATQHA